MVVELGRHAEWVRVTNERDAVSETLIVFCDFLQKISKLIVLFKTQAPFSFSFTATSIFTWYYSTNKITFIKFLQTSLSDLYSVFFYFKGIENS